MSDPYDAWSRRHGGLEVSGSGWVAGWIRLSHRCAAPLARRGVSPDAVSAAGVVVAALVAGVCALGGGWPLLAVPLVVLAGMCDGIDGALAALTGRASAMGRVVDAIADRVGDVLLVLALLALGAPGWLCAAYAVALLLFESIRASAQAAGMDGPGVVTLGERPTRVIIAGVAALLAGLEWLVRLVGVGLVPELDGAALAGVAAMSGLVLTLVSLAQLLPAVRRALG